MFWIFPSFRNGENVHQRDGFGGRFLWRSISGAALSLFCKARKVIGVFLMESPAGYGGGGWPLYWARLLYHLCLGRSFIYMSGVVLINTGRLNAMQPKLKPRPPSYKRASFQKPPIISVRACTQYPLFFPSLFCPIRKCDKNPFFNGFYIWFLLFVLPAAT